MVLLAFNPALAALSATSVIRVRVDCCTLLNFVASVFSDLELVARLGREFVILGVVQCQCQCTKAGGVERAGCRVIIMNALQQNFLHSVTIFAMCHSYIIQ